LITKATTRHTNSTLYYLRHSPYGTFPHCTTTVTPFCFALRSCAPLCITQHYTTLHSTTLHYTALHSTTLHYPALHCTTQHYATLHSTILHYTALHSTTLHYTALNCTTQHYTALHSTTQHYTALHCTTLISTNTARCPSNSLNQMKTCKNISPCCPNVFLDDSLKKAHTVSPKHVASHKIRT
jgi:hypothetical protein